MNTHNSKMQCERHEIKLSLSDSASTRERAHTQPNTDTRNNYILNFIYNNNACDIWENFQKTRGKRWRSYGFLHPRDFKRKLIQLQCTQCRYTLHKFAKDRGTCGAHGLCMSSLKQLFLSCFAHELSFKAHQSEDSWVQRSPELYSAKC